MKPVLWVVSELYYPETTSTGYFVTAIAEGLSREFDVRVLCSRPTYSERGRTVPWSETRAGVRIRRVRSTAFSKDWLPGRIANIITFSIMAALTIWRRSRRGEMILVLTNPPLATLLSAIVIRRKRLKGVLLVHDVYPEVLHATGHLSVDGAASAAIQRVMRWVFRSYMQIVVLGRDMADLVRRKVGDDRPVVIISNWGDPAEVAPMSRQQNEFAALHGLETFTVAQFSGNLGRTHDVETVIEASRRLAHRDRIRFLFVGYGGKADLVATLGEQASNILFAPRQPREMLGPMLACADVTLIAFTRNMLGVSVPSRMYNVMAAAVPIVAMADERSELALVVKEEQCGWVLPVGDVDRLVSLLEFVDTDAGRAEAARRGAAGRRAMLRLYTPEAVIGRFGGLFRGIARLG